jgi:methanogenic corrinoid protein MtbC1
MIDSILASCNHLPRVTPEAAEAYTQATGRLLDLVNGELESHPKIRELIGRNPFEVMWDNHRNHAAFMTTVFRLNSFELLARTVPWVYRAYHARGFSYDYFPAELVAWQIAIHQCLDAPSHKAEILAVYNWMVKRHVDMIRLSVSGEGLSFSVQGEPNEMQQVLLSLLLHGDSKGCLTLVEQSVHTVDDLRRFYLDIVWPAMFSVGHLWESNQISVAEEHLATAIVGRVMAALYPRFARFEVTRGRVVVSAGPNEFHEIGARMVADFLELDGWEVIYLGANTPAAEITGILRRDKPFMVALSVASVFNLDVARQIVRMISDDQEIRATKVMVGGLAFAGMPQLWQEMGAAGYAADAGSAVRVADAWWQERGTVHDQA